MVPKKQKPRVTAGLPPPPLLTPQVSQSLRSVQEVPREPPPHVTHRRGISSAAAPRGGVGNEGRVGGRYYYY